MSFHIEKPASHLEDVPLSETQSDYFATNPAPPTLDSDAAAARAFVAEHARAGRRVVLVTSGGTTVPLEAQTVRFIDNFSAGTRGATSAEYFLREGYAVLFLHRQFSLLPFSRHYSHSTNCFLDFMDEDEPSTLEKDSGSGSGRRGGRIVVREEYQSDMRNILREYRHAKDHNLLLAVPFVTVTDYLYYLRALAVAMRPLGPAALFYLAAAVSDFFIPRSRMAEHKIQSTGDGDGEAERKRTGTDIPPESIYSGYNESSENHHHQSRTADPPKKKLIIDLDPVPKFLNTLVTGWAPPGATVVSFKLETDSSLLTHKSAQALRRYAHHLVIGNLLSTRKWEVMFVSPAAEPVNGGDVENSNNKHAVPGAAGKVEDDVRERWIRIPRERAVSGAAHHVPGSQGIEIESVIVPELAKIHHGRMVLFEREHPGSS